MAPQAAKSESGRGCTSAVLPQLYIHFLHLATRRATLGCVSTAIVDTRALPDGKWGYRAPLFSGGGVSRSLRRGARRWSAAAPPSSDCETQTHDFVFRTWQSCIFRRSRMDGCTLPWHRERRPANRQSCDSQNRSRRFLDGGESKIWKEAMMRSGESVEDGFRPRV